MKSRHPARPEKMRLIYVGGMYLGSDRGQVQLDPRPPAARSPRRPLGSPRNMRTGRCLVTWIGGGVDVQKWLKKCSIPLYSWRYVWISPTESGDSAVSLSR